jgi:hypothetical protein
MKELGIDISSHRSKHVQEFESQSFNEAPKRSNRLHRRGYSQRRSSADCHRKSKHWWPSMSFYASRSKTTARMTRWQSSEAGIIKAKPVARLEFFAMAPLGSFRGWNVDLTMNSVLRTEWKAQA